MDRKEKILSSINKNGLGLEIGPSHDPVAPKKDGFNVDIIDITDRAGLVKRYTESVIKVDYINIDNIEEVDYVWKGETYSELTGKKKYYDWIIASHVIEHVPDLIGFLLSCNEVLKDDGVLTLAVPDMRYCFDHFRPVTGLSKAIDSHLNKQTLSTAGTVAEYHFNVVFKSEHGGWEAPNQRDDDYRLVHCIEDVVNTMNAVAKNKDYIDVHNWCFVPHSFRLMIRDLFDLGFIPFKEVAFYPTTKCEFFVALGRDGTSLPQSRLELLKIIDDEVKEKA